MKNTFSEDGRSSPCAQTSKTAPRANVTHTTLQRLDTAPRAVRD